MGPRWIPPPACLLAALLVSGCESPPNKEMDQAEGAIHAALAAGADKYATTEYSAATDALKNANNAVAQRDYRLALNYALESHEHAENAARDAADAKARTRVEVDRAVVELAALVAQGKIRLAAAERARVPRRLLTSSAADLTAAEASLQKAGETIGADDYLAAKVALEGVKERVQVAIAAINDAMPGRAPQRRR